MDALNATKAAVAEGIVAGTRVCFAGPQLCCFGVTAAVLVLGSRTQLLPLSDRTAALHLEKDPRHCMLKTQSSTPLFHLSHLLPPRKPFPPPGGGSALLHASKTLDAVRDKLENFDQKIGVTIIQNALRVPTKTIASNAGVEGAVVVGKVGMRAPVCQDRMRAHGGMAAPGVAARKFQPRRLCPISSFSICRC